MKVKAINSDGIEIDEWEYKDYIPCPNDSIEIKDKEYLIHSRKFVRAKVPYQGTKLQAYLYLEEK